MAIRTPLYYNTLTGDLTNLSSGEINQIINYLAYRWSVNPTVTLSVTNNSGSNITAINDTRWSAGATSQTNTAFPDEATTQEPQLVTVSYQKILQTVSSLSLPTSTLTDWPAYLTAGGNIQAMSLQDMKDTFFHPAIDVITSASTASTLTGNTYSISTSTVLANHTAVIQPVVGITRNYNVTNAGSGAYTFTGDISGSNPTVNATVGDTLIFVLNASGHPFWIKAEASTGSVNGLTTGTTNNGSAVGTITWDTTGYAPGTYYYNCEFHGSMRGQIVLVDPPATAVFTDTRADLTLFTAGGIPEAQDQPITINNYYLHKRNTGSDPDYTVVPAFITSTGNIQVYDKTTFSNNLTTWLRYLTVNSPDTYRIRYNINGTGNQRGTSMLNSIVGVTNTGNYQTVQIGDDYRAQEFPADVAVEIANVYNLTIDKT
jgi:plastocyanin